MSVNIYARFKTNAELENDGTWVDYGGGLKFKIRRFSAKKSLDVRSELEKPFRMRGGNGDIPAEFAEAVAVKHLARGVVVDWDGVVDTDGKALAFSADQAEKLLTDLPDLAKMLLLDSVNADNFKQADKKEVAGN